MESEKDKISTSIDLKLWHDGISFGISHGYSSSVKEGETQEEAENRIEQTILNYLRNNTMKIKKEVEEIIQGGN